MDFDKLRYYIGGILFIIITLVCTLSVIQVTTGTKNSNILIFDCIAIAITLPLGIFMFRKAKSIKAYEMEGSIEQEVEEVNEPTKISSKTKKILIIAGLNLLLFLGVAIYTFNSDNLWPMIFVCSFELLLGIGINLYLRIKGKNTKS